MRRALADLRRYIGTTETAKHRCFQFIKSEVLPDQKIRVIASDDAFTFDLNAASISRFKTLYWHNRNRKTPLLSIHQERGSARSKNPCYRQRRCFYFRSECGEH